ncbi:uncharacterized protein LOC105250426 isoform X1 [Camponotus floridanus]|uniref:uncharacterized protein LOC105250426 isoform X1 n=1 Tax=Camponotus floridanus TaxID=104421 RepID=UPI00059B5E95|nr:uncharacterized protein LOC105250426 isoform X1 [Camponotus floridanus]
MIFDLLVAGAFALATLRRYSVAQIIAFFFILHLELNSVSGICEQPIPVECNTTDVIPWIRPCGIVLTTETAIRQQQQPQQRHSVHRSLKKVRMKMRIAHYSYMCFKKERQELFKYIINKKRRKYKFDWLPKEQLTWYCKQILCLEKEKKPQHFLPYLYDNLQKFAITFHELEKFRLDSISTGDNESIHIRDWMIDVTFNQILQMLCEVENAMYNLQIDLPPPNNTTITSELAKEGGISRMLVQDWVVLKIYEKFLNDWSLGMRNALNVTIPNTCKIKSLNGTHTENSEQCILKPRRPKKWLKMKKRAKTIKKKNSRGRNSSSNRILRSRLIKLN